MSSFPFWYVIPIAGLIVVAAAALALAPTDTSASLQIPAQNGTANLTLPKLDWGSAFLTVSWAGAPASTQVELFYCAIATCPYENASNLSTGRTTWTEFYGESGASGSISDYWNNANPLTSIHFIVAATGVPNPLSVQVATVYHNPGPGYSWIEVSGGYAVELGVAVVGALAVALGFYLRIRP